MLTIKVDGEVKEIKNIKVKINNEMKDISEIDTKVNETMKPVFVSWEYPVPSGSDLSVAQVYRATKSGNALSIE